MYQASVVAGLERSGHTSIDIITDHTVPEWLSITDAMRLSHYVQLSNILLRTPANLTPPRMSIF